MAKTYGDCRKKTVGQHTDVEGPCLVGQPDAEAPTITDHAGKRLELGRRAVERLGDPYRGWTGKPGAQLPLVEISEDRRSCRRLRLGSSTKP